MDVVLVCKLSKWWWWFGLESGSALPRFTLLAGERRINA